MPVKQRHALKRFQWLKDISSMMTAGDKVKQSKVYVDLYSEFTQTPLMHSDMDHTVLPANNAISAFAPSGRASPPFGRYSLSLPTKGWPG